jgi:hypothetical protein
MIYAALLHSPVVDFLPYSDLKHCKYKQKLMFDVLNPVSLILKLRRDHIIPFVPLGKTPTARKDSISSPIITAISSTASGV